MTMPSTETTVGRGNRAQEPARPATLATRHPPHAGFARAGLPWARLRGALGRLALAGVLAVPPGPALAEEVRIEISEAVELAIQNNPRLRASHERLAARREQALAAARALWPRAALSADLARSDNPARVFASKLNRGEFAQEDFAIDRLNDPEGLSHLGTALAVEAPLDASGAVRAQAEAARAHSRAAEGDYQEEAGDLRLRVVEAYHRATLARSSLAATRRALEGARSREAEIAGRVEEGAALSADLLRARARRRQREADLAEREGDWRIALSALAHEVGAPAGTVYVPTEEAGAPGPLEGDEDSWVGRALERRPALAASRERRGAAEAALRGERRAGWPRLALYAQIQNDRGSFSGGASSASVGAGLRWDVFDATRGRRVAAATAEARASALDAGAAEARVRLEAEVAWRRAQAARHRHAAAAGGAEEAREALRVVRERRREDMATLTDELETEAAALAAELEEARAAAEAAVADARLARAVGSL